MWNPFKAPLPQSVQGSTYPGEYGYPLEHLIEPSELTLDDANYPDLMGIEDSPSQWRSNTGELFQEGNPQYNRPYHPEYHDDVGITPQNEYSSVIPAVGSVDLAFPRQQGGVPGTNRILLGEGPVTGEDYSNWTGQQTALHRPNPNYNGPVVGGPDYSNQLSAAYFQQQAAQYAQAYSEAAMVSAV